MNNFTEKTIILEIEYGGLGDHLFYSPIPRLLKEFLLYEKVFISNFSKKRNIENFNLIWDNNPYIDGYLDVKSINSKVLIYDSIKVNKIMNIILFNYGVNLNYEILPEIYFKHLLSKEYPVKKFIDLNYISYIGSFTLIDKYLILSKYKEYIIINPSLIVKILFFYRKYYYTTSLVDYSSIIYCSDSFVCVASGGATLAAGLGKPSVVYFGYGQSTIFHHTIHKYIQIGGNGIVRKVINKILYDLNNIRVFLSKNK